MYTEKQLDQLWTQLSMKQKIEVFKKYKTSHWISKELLFIVRDLIKKSERIKFRYVSRLFNDVFGVNVGFEKKLINIWERMIYLIRYYMETFKKQELDISFQKCCFKGTHIQYILLLNNKNGLSFNFLNGRICKVRPKFSDKSNKIVDFDYCFTINHISNPDCKNIFIDQNSKFQSTTTWDDISKYLQNYEKYECRFKSLKTSKEKRKSLLNDLKNLLIQNHFIC